MAITSRKAQLISGGIIVVVLMVILVLSKSQDKPTATEALVIETADGSIYNFKVEIADTLEEKTKGLMFRKELGKGEGMLFLNEQEELMAMWMKNTYIPLDIIFIQRDGRIANIHANAQPHDLTPLPSQGPVWAALEIQAGLTEKYGIKPGDKVSSKAFIK